MYFDHAVREAPGGKMDVQSEFCCGRGGWNGLSNGLWGSSVNINHYWSTEFLYVIFHHYLPWYLSEYHLRIMLDPCRCKPWPTKTLSMSLPKTYQNLTKTLPKPLLHFITSMLNNMLSYQSWHYPDNHDFHNVPAREEQEDKVIK